MTTFARLLADLARAEVAFLTVGGLAVAQAGYARYTEDVDVLVATKPASLDRLVGVLAKIHPDAAGLTAANFPLEEGAVRVVGDLVVDIFTLMSGHTYADLLPLSDVHEVEGQPVRFLSAEGLLRLKAPSLRPKDQTDAAELRRMLDEQNRQANSDG